MVACKGAGVCHLCHVRSDASDGPVPHKCHRHRVAYSITGAPGRDVVFFTVDRPYTDAWLFLRTDVQPQEHEWIHTFLSRQLGRGFNRRGVWANFIAPRCMHRGVPSTALRRYMEYRWPYWFCSELAAVACRALGVCLDTPPMYMSPAGLWTGAVCSRRFVQCGVPRDPAPSPEPVPRSTVSLEASYTSVYSLESWE